MTGFQVSGLSLANGAVWQINREIVVSFSEPVDFASVSSNTIHIRSLAGAPAAGSFVLRDPSTVVFQPSCPTRADLSDAGLKPGGVTYVLRIPGLDMSSNTLRSSSGVALKDTQVRTFRTPASNSPSIVFQDTKSGPPVPVLREQGSSEPDATYLEIGGDSAARVYFELDAQQQLVLSEPGFAAPLNLYSDPAARVALELFFDQPVDPSTGNVSESRLRLEYRDSSGAWRVLRTRVSLEANCGSGGARVRLEPVGVLPPSSVFRAVVRAGFKDLVGEAVQQSLDGFARAPTHVVAYTSLVPSDRMADGLDESFDFAAGSPLSFEDESAVLDAPFAEWGGGELTSAFSFDGDGGPNGDFDWIVRSGEHFFFDTSTASIMGGPNGVPTTTQNVANGIVDVRNLTIQAGGEIRVQGPNPMRIRATGEVRIEGLLDISGFAAKDVVTLNTGNQPEAGGAGTAGGGKGGTANENTGGSSVRGGSGFGPRLQAGLGGQGGELGVSDRNSSHSRRPGGGGGGAFAKGWEGSFTPPDVSVVPGNGSDGHADSIGAESGVKPSKGGRAGVGAFLDASDENDFFGTRLVVRDGGSIEIVHGELGGPWGGYGGGGGGNATQTYPNPLWTFASDEKGGGGGGGGGALHIQALGSIVFTGSGRILANGAAGGTGENTAGYDHVGGTGGGGSGGHVILESGGKVDFTGGGSNMELPLADHVQAAGPVRKTGNTQFVGQHAALSNGGAGGGGVIQIHVPEVLAAPGPDPEVTDVVIPPDALQLSEPLDAFLSPPAYVLVPSFGARSKARSKWVSIGGADQKPTGGEGLVRFLFGGTETAGEDAGKVRTAGSTVVDLPPLFETADFAASPDVHLLPDGLTLELTGAALGSIRGGTTSGISNDVYLRTPALLQECSVRLRVVSTPTNFLDFDVASAQYEEGSPGLGDELLRVTVTNERGRLDEFNPEHQVSMSLMQRFFRVETNGLRDVLPSTAFVRILFQAAADNGAGAPDELNPLVDWTADIQRFNTLPPGALQFFRYEVEFDLDAEAQGISGDTEAVTLDFLEIPFIF